VGSEPYDARRLGVGADAVAGGAAGGVGGGGEGGPVMVDSSLWPMVSGHADRLLQLLEDRRFEGQARDVAAIFMYSRTRRLYEAALLLLKAHLPEEAAILGRSLFETAMQLMQLAADAADRDVLIIGWAGDSLNRRESLFHTAKSLGLDPDVSEKLALLKEQRKRLDAYAAGRRWKPFLEPREAALRFDRKDDFWTYEWAHQSVHGGEASSIFSTRVEGDTTRLHAKTDEPRVLGLFAQFAARAMADAATATYKIVGWTPIPDFEEPVRAMEQLLAGHQEIASEAG
jgi:hypothetical protein